MSNPETRPEDEMTLAQVEWEMAHAELDKVLPAASPLLSEPPAPSTPNADLGPWRTGFADWKFWGAGHGDPKLAPGVAQVFALDLICADARISALRHRVGKLESPPAPSSPETENDKELDRLIAALLDAKRWLLESEGYTEDHREFCRERFSNARSALVALYNRQRKEIKGLQTMIDALQTSHRADTASLSSQLERLTGTVNGIALLFGIETTSNDVVVDTVRAELERLKAEAWEGSVAATENQREVDRLEEELARRITLDPAEATMLIGFLEATPMKYPPELVVLWKKLRLRSLSDQEGR